MKTLFVTIIATFFLLNKGLGQNLVMNPSFEDTVFCPWAENQLPLYWTSFGASPDYFNACSDALNVPNTPTGFHPANSGNGMIGVFNYVNPNSSGWPNYREYIGTALVNPLVIGQKYYFSFFLSFAKIYPNGWGGIGSDKLGLKCSTVSYSVNNPPTLNNNAHLYTDSIYNDTAQWVKISGLFIADSAYNYLTLGNFFDESHTDTLYFGPQPIGITSSYYFIDDICVTADSLYNETWLGIKKEGGDNFNEMFSVSPNPVNNFINFSCNLQNTFGIEIYNTLGQLLYTQKNITSQNLQLDITSYNKGLLFIKIESQNNQFMYKLLKQ